MFPSALPPVLESLEWLVGRWETESRNGVLHPLDLGDAYNETLIVRLSAQPLNGRESLELLSQSETASGDSAKSTGQSIRDCDGSGRAFPDRPKLGGPGTAADHRHRLKRGQDRPHRSTTVSQDS